MAAAQASQQYEPPYLLFEELRSNEVHVLFSEATKRLFWPLSGTFPTATSVMKTDSSPDSFQSFFQPGSGTWHEISHLPLTEPKVSSIEASVYDLKHWESSWIEQHRYHESDEVVTTTYGDLSDDDRPGPANMNGDGD